MLEEVFRSPGDPAAHTWCSPLALNIVYILRQKNNYIERKQDGIHGDYKQFNDPLPHQYCTAFKISVMIAVYDFKGQVTGCGLHGTVMFPFFF